MLLAYKILDSRQEDPDLPSLHTIYTMLLPIPLLSTAGVVALIALKKCRCEHSTACNRCKPSLKWIRNKRNNQRRGSAIHAATCSSKATSAEPGTPPAAPAQPLQRSASKAPHSASCSPLRRTGKAVSPGKLVCLLDVNGGLLSLQPGGQGWDLVAVPAQDPHQSAAHSSQILFSQLISRGQTKVSISTL